MTDEQRDLIESNYKLIYSFLNKKCNKAYNYDECEFHAINGYLKAAMTFDNDRAKFTTYAYRCMFNEVSMFVRKEDKKNQREIPEQLLLKELAGIKSGETALKKMVQRCDEAEKTKILQEVRRGILKHAVNGNRGKKFNNLIRRYELDINATQFAKLNNVTQSAISQAEVRAIEVLKKDKELIRLFGQYKALEC